MRNWKEFARKLLRPTFKVLSWNLPGGTPENHIKFHSGWPVSRLRSENGTF
jgi:hypothetical protein